MPLAYTTAYTVFGLGCVVAPQIPNNAGSLAPLTVSAPEGCILNAPKPAPVCIRHVIGQMLPDVVFGCLHQVIPGARAGRRHVVPVESQRARRDAGRRRRQLRVHRWRSPRNGGTGARPDKDGLSATAYPSGVRGTPVEIAESQTPLIFWRKELRPDSGGAGRTRGGLGQIIEIEQRHRPAVRHPGGVRPHRPSAARPRRRAGTARPATSALKSGQKLRGKGFQAVPPGDRLVVHDAGRRRHRRAGRARSRARRATIWPTGWSRRRRHGSCTATRRLQGGGVSGAVNERKGVFDEIGTQDAT